MAVVALWAMSMGPMASSAHAQQATSETYLWHAELVGLDATRRVVTVKSGVIGDQIAKDIPKLKAGDRVWLGWSGIDRYAHAVRSAVRRDAGARSNDLFTFPAEFVAFDTTSQYVTFRVEAPAAGVEALKAVKPGEWVTATSRQRPSSETESVTTIRHYNAPAASVTATQ
jgi:hypothetical protein